MSKEEEACTHFTIIEELLGSKDTHKAWRLLKAERFGNGPENALLLRSLHNPMSALKRLQA